MPNQLVRSFRWALSRKLGVVEKRVLVVVALFAGLSSVPDIALPWSDVGSLGFTADSKGYIKSVAHNGPAELNGMRVGQHIDLEKTPPESRRYLLDLGYAADGTQARYFDDQISRRPVTITSAKAEFSGIESAASVLFGLTYLFLIYTGFRLAFEKPSLMTRAFFWYAIMTSNWSWLLSANLPWTWYQPWSTLQGFLYVLDWVPLVLFALVFPRGTADDWRARAPLPYAVLVLVGALLSVAGVIGYWQRPGNPLTQSIFYEPFAGLLIALVLVCINFFRAKGAEQAQLALVMSALIVGDVGTTFATLATFAPWPTLEIWKINALSSFNIVVPIAVLIAIYRYHLFGIPTPRRVVYPVLAGLVLGVRAVLEHYIGHLTFAPVVEVLVAIVVAIAFGALQGRIGRWIKRRGFKRQRLARRALRHAANAIVRVPGETELAALLVGAVAARLGLASAALYRRGPEGFKRAASFGSDAGMLDAVEDGNEIVKLIRRQPKPLAVADTMLAAERLTGNARGPLVALPVVVRNEVEAILVYGQYRSGSELDRYDVKTLRHLAANAAHAYERLRAKHERETLREVGVILGRLRGIARTGDGRLQAR